MSLWKGPTETGITQSLLQKFILCRDRFWLHVCEGLRERDEWKFAKYAEFGSAFHEALEYDLSDRDPIKAINNYHKKLTPRFPTDREAVDYEMVCCKKLFDEYKKFWTNKDAKHTTILSEEVFSVPYTLPSGRVVKIKGKWDCVFKPTVRSNKIYLLEHKTKGTIDESKITTQLHADLQVGVYLTALQAWAAIHHPKKKVHGVIYNVIRRPFGDQSAPRLRKNESQGALIQRAFHGEEGKKPNPKSVYPVDQNGKEWFKRWKVAFTDEDLATFQQRHLNPQLEQLCIWWDSIKDNPDNPWKTTNKSREHGQVPYVENPYHWRRPFGVYDPMSLGYEGGYYEYCTSGSKIGLEHVDTLFPELEN